MLKVHFPILQPVAVRRANHQAWTRRATRTDSLVHQDVWVTDGESGTSFLDDERAQSLYPLGRIRQDIDTKTLA